MVKILVETTMGSSIPIIVLNDIDLEFNEDFKHIRYQFPLNSKAEKLYSVLVNDLQIRDIIVILLKENFLSNNEFICKHIVAALREEQTCISFVTVESGNGTGYQNVLDILK